VSRRNWQRRLVKRSRRNRAGLRRRMAGADGLQQTADARASTHHFANTLFNASARGTFNALTYPLPRGARGNDGRLSVPRRRFRGVRAPHNHQVAVRHGDWLAALPKRFRGRNSAARLLSAAMRNWRGSPASISADLQPPPRRSSRPWNGFQIRLKDAHGDPLYAFKATGATFSRIGRRWRRVPWLAGHFIGVFLNASTADGYTLTVSAATASIGKSTTRTIRGATSATGRSPDCLSVAPAGKPGTFRTWPVGQPATSDAFAYAHVPYESLASMRWSATRAIRSRSIMSYTAA